MSALLVESLLSSDIFSLLLLVGGQSSVVGELSSVSRSVSIMSVVTGGKALPSDSYSLDSVVGDLFSGSSPLFHIIPAVSW